MQFKLICLGVGNGTSYILRGVTSSSFVLTIEDRPFLLVDCGVGVGLAYKKYFGDIIPENIYISHNHTDHTGDLPIMLIDFHKRSNSKINVFGQKKVLEIVKKHRLHEFHAAGINIENLANWVHQNQANEIEINSSLKLNLIKSLHSYLCYGFNLEFKKKFILGYSADSGFDTTIYDFISKADEIIIDGRLNSSSEHASFQEIEAYALSKPSKIFHVIHHEIENYQFKLDNVSYLKQYSEIILQNMPYKNVVL